MAPVLAVYRSGSFPWLNVYGLHIDGNLCKFNIHKLPYFPRYQYRGLHYGYISILKSTLISEKFKPGIRLADNCCQPIRSHIMKSLLINMDFMMTSSNGNIFRVTGPLCGEFTVPGEFPTQRPVTRSFDVFFDMRLNKRLSKQPWDWWFETPSWSSWRQCNVLHGLYFDPLTPEIC